MKIEVPDAMRQALEDVRAGRLSEATALIKKSLSMQDMPTLDRLKGPATPLGPRGGHAPAATPPGRHRFTCASGSRDYAIHLPDDAPPRGLVLMLHGCTQTPEDFDRGTRMSERAGAKGLAVVYPAQSRGDNAQSCWNWFSGADQQRDRGEPAILAGLVRDVAARHDVPEGAIYVAGLSAGAAMAVILGRTHPDLFAGVGAHSGLPYGRTRGVAEAFSAMAGQDTGKRGKPADRPVPTIIFHGTSDATVVPVNGEMIFHDALAANDRKAELIEDGTAGGRRFERSTSLAADGGVAAEHWRIDGLGHAWSGGSPSGSYADAKGPDASAEMIRFFLSLQPATK